MNKIENTDAGFVNVARKNAVKNKRLEIKELQSPDVKASHIKAAIIGHSLNGASYEDIAAATGLHVDYVIAIVQAYKQSKK